VLIPATGQAKVGVDDFLLRHAVEELITLTNHVANAGEADPATTEIPYRKTPRGLLWEKPTRDGFVAVPLTNFTAQIVADVLADDGAEQPRQFELEAVMAGRSRRFTVSAAQFAGLGWVREHLGAQAMVFPGQSTKDHARAAIQLLSDIIVERRIFRHTGWRRNRDGEWYYFHGGGVLGQNGQVANMEVSRPSGLERLVLPTNGQPLGRSPDQRNPLKISRESGQVGQVFTALEIRSTESAVMPESGTRLRSGAQKNLTKNLTTPEEWEEI
jgi:hypothetical protein